MVRIMINILLVKKTFFLQIFLLIANLLILSVSSVKSKESIASDLLTSETGYPKPPHEPEYSHPKGYYKHPAQYDSYETSLEYGNPLYPAHDLYLDYKPKSAAHLPNYYYNLPKSYPIYEPHYDPKSYSDSYDPSVYGYSAPPHKPYDLYKPKKYSHSYTPPTHLSEYLKYRPTKVYKYTSISYHPNDEYYKPYPSYSPEYHAYGSSKPYSSTTYEYPNKHLYSSDYSPPTYSNYYPKEDYSSSYYKEPKSKILKSY